jgi:dipeptidase
MYSDYLFTIVQGLDWFTPSRDDSRVMDWLPTVSNGEYSHPYYSLRRVWRGLSLMALSLNLDPWAPVVDKGLTRAYPFPVKPDKKIALSDVIALHRDHYAGTEFDLTKGMAAGPRGNPNRYLGPRNPSGDVGDPNAKLDGAWERPIGIYWTCSITRLVIEQVLRKTWISRGNPRFPSSLNGCCSETEVSEQLYYTNVTYVNQARSDLPYPINIVSWIALDAISESVFVPLAISPIPSMHEAYNAAVFNMDSDAWQIYNLVAEYANIKYCYMIKDINQAQSENERAGFELVAILQAVLARIAPDNRICQFFP